MNDNNYGPVWAVNTEEVWFGLIALGSVLILPLFPAYLLGYHVLSGAGSMNIVRWGITLALILFVTWLYYKAFQRWQWLGFFLLFAIQWLGLDAYGAISRDGAMISWQLLVALGKWMVAVS
jgi:hypothetical protein